jgi:hypothetical protein
MTQRGAAPWRAQRERASRWAIALLAAIILGRVIVYNPKPSGPHMKGTLGLLTATLITLSLGSIGCDDSAPTSTSNGANKGANASSTAQSAMLDLSGDASFVVNESSVYQFDATAAAAYFSGGTATQRRNVAQQQRCTFWDGGTLTSATVGGGPGAVTITPIAATNPVAAGTAWTLVSSETSTVDITFDGVIVGESWMANKQHPIGTGGIGTGGKYSFTLRNPDGTSRVQGLAYSLDGGTTWTDIVATQGHVDDIEYLKTAGNTALVDGWVASILTGDTHPGNDGTGANIETFSIDLNGLGSGDYSLLVKGTIKGVEGLSDMAFEVSRNVTVSAGNCAN